MTAADMGQSIHEGRGAAELPAFLAAGGDVSAVDPQSGMPLLHLACEHLDLDAIRALVAAGAGLNVGDSFGQTPLHVAVANDIDSIVQADGPEFRFEATRLLLSLGADPFVQDGSGRTPRDLAAGYGGRVLDQFDHLCGPSA